MVLVHVCIIYNTAIFFFFFFFFFFFHFDEIGEKPWAEARALTEL